MRKRIITTKFSARRLIYDMFLERIGLGTRNQFEKRKIIRRNRIRYYTTYPDEIYDINTRHGCYPWPKKSRKKKETKRCSRLQKKLKLKQ